MLVFSQWIASTDINIAFYLLHHRSINLEKFPYPFIILANFLCISKSSLQTLEHFFLTLQLEFSICLWFSLWYMIYIQWNAQIRSAAFADFGQNAFTLQCKSLSIYRAPPLPESSLLGAYFDIFIFDECICLCNRYPDGQIERFHLLRDSCFTSLKSVLTLPICIWQSRFHCWNFMEVHINTFYDMHHVW
jgi:hypothetical protein